MTTAKHKKVSVKKAVTKKATAKRGRSRKKKPLFILGMGAQKAGTSWLHKMLSIQDNVNLGYRKEYHIWDFVFSDIANGVAAPLKKPDKADAALRRLMQQSSEIYTKYFHSLIDSYVNVTGDITPSYSIIDESNLKKISSIIKRAGFDLKVVFFMRDPIERIWSCVRMEKRNMLRRGKTLKENFLDLRIEKYLSMKQHILRSDYKRTVQNISKAFNEDEIHFGFYERLFTEKGLNILQDFLGFNLKNVDFDIKVNVSTQEAMSEATYKLLSEFLAPQYEFCKDKFPEVNKLWPNIR